MKNTAWILMAMLALAPVDIAAQGRGKAKGKTTEPATAQPANEASQGKAKGQAKKGQTAGTGGSAATQGAGSCSPDTTPPVIHAVTATPKVLWSPNHRMTPVSIAANVSDNCPGVTWSVTSITSDEPVNGTGEGDTEPDWAVASPHSVTLRAERAGSGDGRVYTVTITARDAAGNNTAGTTTVTVPHNQR